MMIKIRYILSVLTLLSISHAFAFTSMTLGKETIAAAIKHSGNCLRYQVPKRFCVWLSPLVGKNFTPMLDHYLPDLVVVVYRHPDENPWWEAKNLIDKLPSEFLKRALPHVGSGNHDFIGSNDLAVIFKEADVIGNPGLLLLPHYLSYLLLPSTAIPMRPYYQSMLDSTLWRGFMPQAAFEEAESTVYGSLHKIGEDVLTNWGEVYPHEGSVQSNNDAKASMVIAQRAVDLLTNKKVFGHIRKSLPTTCGEHCDAAPIKENSEETLFQMVYPISTSECDVFGKEASYKEDRLSKDGNYAWIVWRHYKGCLEGDGKFLGVVP